jgi:hypothetical protein
MNELKPSGVSSSVSVLLHTGPDTFSVFVISLGIDEKFFMQGRVRIRHFLNSSPGIDVLGGYVM